MSEKKLLRFQVFVQRREDLSQYRECRERIWFLLGNQMLESMKGVRDEKSDAQGLMGEKKLLRFQVFVQKREDLGQYREYRERIEFLLGNQMLEGIRGVRDK